jgi:hypothetical protein
VVKTITPFSTRAKEGATDSPLGDFVSVDQTIMSTAQAGFFDRATGKLTGIIGSEQSFNIMQTDLAIPNTGEILTPSVNNDGTWPLDMTGFNSLFIAIKPTNAGNYKIEAVMGPDSNSFANLSPVNPASLLYGNLYNKQEFQKLFGDNAESLTADVWNIFYIEQVLQNQKLLQFKITNNSGGASDIETAFMRLV